MNNLKKIKDIFKNKRFLLNKILNFYKKDKKKKSIYRNMLNKESIKDRFSEIYAQNLWHSNESRSGEGSEIRYTESLREWLAKIVGELNINKVVDAACGDFNWMRLLLNEIDVVYLGCDIVESVIEENTKKYSDKNVQFTVSDICVDQLPDCDLLLVRDCLFHLSFDDINKFFQNLEKTDYKFLLTTSHITDNDFINKDILTGDFRWLDLKKSPINISDNSIIHRFQEPSPVSVGREMIMIRKEDVPTCIVR